MVNSEHKPDEELRRAARDAATSGDIHQRVRDLTLQALRNKTINQEEIREVIHEILTGAESGIQESGADIKAGLGEVTAGIDEALAKSATATQLAIEEALGHVREFSDHDIKRAINDIEGLESTFIDVVRDVARSSSDLAKKILDDLATHGKNSGTIVGTQAQRSLSALNSQLQQLGRDSLVKGADTAKSASVRIARAASGFLAGLADIIEGVETRAAEAKKRVDE